MRYLICIPCVNREEKANVKNVLHITFRSLEEGGVFQQKKIPFDIFLFESGSKNLEYLQFLEEYRQKYPHIQIKVLEHPTPLDGYTNTHRMFLHLTQFDKEDRTYDYVIWMDDDILVCKKFMENVDGWMRKFGHKSIFTSLYVCYPSFPSKIHPSVYYSHIFNYYGSCCTIFRPQLAKAVPHLFFQKVGKPDSKFRRCIEHFFPNHPTILVPKVSFVQHLNAGSVNHAGTDYKGHRSHNFVGVKRDPKYWI
jgi:hypothetical protein